MRNICDFNVSQELHLHLAKQINGKYSAMIPELIISDYTEQFCESVITFNKRYQNNILFSGNKRIIARI